MTPSHTIVGITGTNKKEKQMKLTLKEVKEIEKALAMLSNIDITNDKLRYRVSRNMRKLKNDLEIIEEKRVELAKKNGATKEHGVPEENMDSFNEEINEFLKVETEIDIQPIMGDTLKGLSIKPLIITLLGDAYTPSEDEKN